jgi:hypothetical protein
MPSLASRTVVSAALLAVRVLAGPCVAPGTCKAPATAFSRVVEGPAPGVQWETSGGFCGAFSVQHAALGFGAWISQDLVRKANRDQTGIPHNMHGDPTVGFEVMPINVAYTAEKLKLNYVEWDSSAPSPQAPAYKRWLKAHLAAGSPVVWFPICKGDPHECYPGSCPNGGQCDHVELMYGLYSNHALSDAAVYDDDVIVHTSDQDLEPYFRKINSLDDSLAMNGNCKAAVPVRRRSSAHVLHRRARLTASARVYHCRARRHAADATARLTLCALPPRPAALLPAGLWTQ